MLRVYRVVLVLLLILLPCSMGGPLPAAASPEGRQTASLQLRWSPQFQFAGYYAADWLGYYAEEGLDVEIRSAFRDGVVLSATEEVAQGRADFGVGAADILIAQDQGRELSLVASFFQRSAVAYYALADTRLNTVYDLARLNIARRKGDLLDVELQALFLSEGIHPFSTRYADIPRDFTVEDLTSGRFQLVPGYLGKIAYQAEQMGIPLRTVSPQEYGIDFYGDTLFTGAALAKSDPELVERFRRATVKGWTYALEHPEELADKIAMTAYMHPGTGQTLEELVRFNRHQARQVLQLTHYPIVEIGNLNPHRWAKMAQTLTELHIITREPDMGQMIFDYAAIRLNQLRQAGETAKGFFAASLMIIALFFILHLKQNNTLLKHEIAVRREAEAMLLYQARMAAMGEMIGNIAHQWRQPLNTLHLLLTNLQDAQTEAEPDPVYIRSAFGKAHGIIGKMSAIIDDFRYYATPQNEPRAFDVSAPLQAAVELLEDQLISVSIELDIRQEEPCRLVGMDNQLAHVFFNLISNSAQALQDHVPAGHEPRRILISLKEEAGVITADIEDNGPGIPPESAPRIFDMYYTTRSDAGGTGLGLHMARQIVETGFQGTLELVPSAAGAHFRLTLPSPAKGVTP